MVVCAFVNVKLLQVAEWPIVWATLRTRLIRELPPEALSLLRTAFDFAGANSVQKFFEDTMWVGSQKQRNCQKLLLVLTESYGQTPVFAGLAEALQSIKCVFFQSHGVLYSCQSLDGCRAPQEA